MLRPVGRTISYQTTGSVARWSYFFEDLAESTKTVALLYEEMLSKNAGWFGERAVIFRHQKGIHIPDRYDHSDKANHIGETRTSVGTGIMIAHIMGCSKIILLGIDGVRQFGCRYFWQLSPHISPCRTEPYKKPYRNDRSHWDCFRKVRVKGQVTDTDLIDINKSWSSLGKALNKKCKVYNASENSTLKAFPKIDLERFLEDL